jgi:hypothetical protein
MKLAETRNVAENNAILKYMPDDLNDVSSSQITINTTQFLCQDNFFCLFRDVN